MMRVPELLDNRNLSHLSFTWLSPSEAGVVASVSAAVNKSASCDTVWKALYLRRFGDENAEGGKDFKRAFQERLHDPAEGDVVEVSWRGKFHLDAEHVFAGLSWWMATVVAKSSTGGYKVHYSSWNRSWDEWVRPNRLRWPSRFTSGSARAAKALKGEIVEVWCHGEGVGGAWLEARVRKATRSAVCLTDTAVSSERLWVTTDRICRKEDIPRPLCMAARSANSRRGGGGSRELVPHSLSAVRRPGVCLRRVWMRGAGMIKTLLAIPAPAH